MLTGLKLDIGFAEDEVCRRLYDGREILSYIRELGFEAVETPVGPETPPEALCAHVARCIDAGLRVSLHPYSEGSIFNPAYFSSRADNPCRVLHERFLAAAGEITRRQHYPTVVNIHAAAGAGAGTEARQDLLEQSIAFFSWAGAWCRQNAPEVRVTAELQISPNPDEPRQRIGDTYAELLEIATRSGVRLCWDFGHAYWNTFRYGRSLNPPEALLPHIGHVHCHDVRHDDHGGEDHQPLVYDTVPWRDFIVLLAGYGFDGRIILEVPPTEFLKAAGLPSLIESARVLQDTRRRVRSETRR